MVYGEQAAQLPRIPQLAGVVIPVQRRWEAGVVVGGCAEEVAVAAAAGLKVGQGSAGQGMPLTASQGHASCRGMMWQALAG